MLSLFYVEFVHHSSLASSNTVWSLSNISFGTHRCLNRFYQSWNFQSRCQEQFCNLQISEQFCLRPCLSYCSTVSLASNICLAHSKLLSQHFGPFFSQSWHRDTMYSPTCVTLLWECCCLKKKKLQCHAKKLERASQSKLRSGNLLRSAAVPLVDSCISSFRLSII